MARIGRELGNPKLEKAARERPTLASVLAAANNAPTMH
jgi:hypothetical protein